MNANFFVSTADALGAKIDETSSITVAPTCIFNLTNGVFANTNMPVNSQYLNPQITFASTPTISMQTGDTIELHFSPLANFNSCSRLQLWRDIANSMSAPLSQTTTFYQYTLPESNS